MPPHPAKQKLYCFVDETGQDTKGELFIVAIVITASDVEPLRTALERIETASTKGVRKWLHTNQKRRLAYIRLVTENSLFADAIRYAYYQEDKNYQHLTTLATAQAILEKAADDYEATVFIDGLGKTERYVVRTTLRRLQVKVRKVSGLTDQADALIRLADAMAGFVRDYLEGDAAAKPLYEQAVKSGIIKRL